jgi:hypothetical protein
MSLPGKTPAKVRGKEKNVLAQKGTAGPVEPMSNAGIEDKLQPARISPPADSRSNSGEAATTTTTTTTMYLSPQKTSV